MINTAPHSNSPHVMYKKYKRLVYTPPQQDFVQQTSETCRTQKNRPDLFSRPNILSSRVNLWLLNVIEDDCCFLGVQSI